MKPIDRAAIELDQSALALGFTPDEAEGFRAAMDAFGRATARLVVAGKLTPLQAVQKVTRHAGRLAAEAMEKRERKTRS